MKFEEIEIGQKAEIKHQISQSDIHKFVELTGDDNKLHVNKEYAQKTSFKKPVAHGMLGASFISTIIGTKLPGDGALWFSQNLEFLLPVRVGDMLTISAIVLGKNKREQSIELKTDIVNQNKQLVTTGTAKVKVVEQELLSEDFENELEVKNIVVFGASGGIGISTVKKLLANGHLVFAHYNSNKEALEKLKDERSDSNLILIKADLRKSEDISDLMETVKRHSKQVDALVYATSFSVPNIDLEKVTWSDVQHQLDMHVKYPFEIINQFSSFFPDKGGSIVLLTSQTVDQPFAKLSHYTIAKSAQQGLMKSLAVDLAVKKIRVNAVSPSITDTNLNSDLPAKVKLVTAAKTPLKRLSQPNDVAQAICFLCDSEKSGFITGETIRVNGGQVML